MTTPSAASSSEVAIDEKHGAPSEMVKPPMAGLSEQEKEIIERQIEAPKLDVGYFALFRYASRNEFIIMVIAVIASIAAGAVMPLMTVRILLECFMMKKRLAHHLLNQSNQSFREHN
jgi:ATP-binding cassette subfamily B (MDR/TAP) protein 1